MTQSIRQNEGNKKPFPFPDAPPSPLMLPSQLLLSYQFTPPPLTLYSEEASVAVQRAAGITDGHGLPTGMTAEEGQEASYTIPDDADGLDLQHETFRLLLDGWLALAPMRVVPKYVLDIGTGTGSWAFRFAEQNPSSHVIGVDINTTPRTTNLPNLTFRKDDVRQAWGFQEPQPDEGQHQISFNYVHLLMSSFFDDPRAVIRNAYDNMAPGGWVEFHEVDLTFSQTNTSFKGDALTRWSDAVRKGATAQGCNVQVFEEYTAWLRESGFTEVSARRVALPCNPWPQNKKLKKVGWYNLGNLCSIAQGYSKFLQAAGMAAEEVDTLISEVRSELKDPRNHSWSWVWVVCAQKPASAK